MPKKQKKTLSSTLPRIFVLAAPFIHYSIGIMFVVELHFDLLPLISDELIEDIMHFNLFLFFRVKPMWPGLGLWRTSSFSSPRPTLIFPRLIPAFSREIFFYQPFEYVHPVRPPVIGSFQTWGERNGKINPIIGRLSEAHTGKLQIVYHSKGYNLCLSYHWTDQVGVGKSLGLSEDGLLLVTLQAKQSPSYANSNLSWFDLWSLIFCLLFYGKVSLTCPSV